MMKFIMILVAAGILVGLSSLFIVDERQLAIKFRLGEIVESDYEPGLHVKAPWPIMNVRKFDKRILTLDTRPERFLTGEKKNVSCSWNLTNAPSSRWYLMIARK
jgi:membrane protease subunit HflC